MVSTMINNVINHYCCFVIQVAKTNFVSDI